MRPKNTYGIYHVTKAGYLITSIWFGTIHNKILNNKLGIHKTFLRNARVVSERWGSSVNFSLFVTFNT